MKFKNVHNNKKVLARKNAKLSGNLNAWKGNEKDEEKFKYIETENKLLINKDYYDV